jgi:hypothetical protein
VQGVDQEIDKIDRTKRRPSGRRFAFSLRVGSRCQPADVNMAT